MEAAASGAADVIQWSEDSIAPQILAKVERCRLVERASLEALFSTVLTASANTRGTTRVRKHGISENSP